MGFGTIDAAEDRARRRGHAPPHRALPPDPLGLAHPKHRAPMIAIPYWLLGLVALVLAGLVLIARWWEGRAR